MMKNIKCKNDELMNWLFKLSILMFVITSVLLMINVFGTTKIKKDIESETQKITEHLYNDTGAESIDINVYTKPGRYFWLNPANAEYHVFVKVNVSNVKLKKEDEWKAILMNGQDDSENDYSYYANDYAVYTREITSALCSKKSPVFLTITDGEVSYSLYNDSYYGDAKLVKEDGLAKLKPSVGKFTINTLVISLICYFFVFIGVLYRQINKRKLINEAAEKYYLLCREAKLTYLEKDKFSSEAFELGKNISNELKIVNFSESYIDLYNIGYEKRKMLIKSTGDYTTVTPETFIGNVLEDINVEVGIDHAKMIKEKRNKYIKLIIGIVSIVIIITIIAIKYIVIPSKQYNNAIALKEIGNDLEAYNAFKELGNFRDSMNICNEYDYAKSLDMIKQGDVANAYYLLNTISRYELARIKCDELLAQYPCLSVVNAELGEEFLIGKYEQDGNLDNGKEDMAWIVFYNNEGKIYLVSKYILDAKVYNTVEGEGSTLKKWLKEEFYKEAFDLDEAVLINKVGLLTREDITNYKDYINTEPEWTIYAKMQSPSNSYYGGYSWWLDGDYFNGLGMSMSVVIENGSYNNYISEITTVNGVRPILIIDASGDGIDYYLEDYDDIENAGIATKRNDDYKSDNSSSDKKNTYKRSACSGGSVGCRDGFHPCNENKDGYCVSCCPD